MVTGYLSLEALAARLNLPQRYLRDLAADKVIPYLDVNGRLRFCEPEVREALSNLAQKSQHGKKEIIKCTA